MEIPEESPSIPNEWTGDEDFRISMKRRISDPLEEAVISSHDVTNLVQRESEFDIFGKSVAAQLNQLPIEFALEIQQEIQYIIIERRLSYLRRKQCKLPPHFDVD